MMWPSGGMVDAHDLKSCAVRRAGSSPAWATMVKYLNFMYPMHIATMVHGV